MAQQQVIHNASLTPNKQLISSSIKLNDGNTIPSIGLGTYSDKKDDEKEEKQLKQAIITAIKYGYRQIDSAQDYSTEHVTADALKELYAANIVKRQDVFITTKISSRIRKTQAVKDSIERSLKQLNTEYIDLYLIDSPLTHNKEGARGHDVIAIYKILHEYRSNGKIKSIGVSNFNVKHLAILSAACPTLPVPVCNQIECHPFYQNNTLISYCANNNILIQSYAPLARFNDTVKKNDILREIAKKYSKSLSQIMLRWNIQKGFVPLPKSITTSRIISNGDVFGFVLKEEDMKRLNGLSKVNMCVVENSMDQVWDDTYALSQQQNEILKDLNDVNTKTDELEQRMNGITNDEVRSPADQLEENLQSRTDKNTLQNKNILRNKGMANALQANAKALEQQQTKDKLKKGIAERIDADTLYASGITGYKGVAHSLQAAAKSLEMQKKIDKLKQWQEIEDIEEHDLYESGIKIKQYKGMAHSLQATAQTLEKGIKTDTLNKQMANRTDENVLYESGIKRNKGIAHSLQANAKSLSQQQTKDKLKKGIQDRSDIDRVYDTGIGGIKGVAHSLQAAAKSLDKQKKIDKLKQWQEVDDVDEDILYESGIKKYKGMADSLHPVAESLQRGLKSDTLSKQMGKRSDESALHDTGIRKHKGMAGALQANATILAAQRVKDKLKKKIRARSASDSFYDSGISGLKGVANSLQATAKLLEKQRKMDILKQWQEVEDVEEDDLYEAGIKKYKGMAHSLQPKAEALANEQRKDTLRKQWKNRADPKELQMRGILKQPSRYDDADLEQETQHIIASLTEDELNALKATLQADIKGKNEGVDPSIYVYLNGIIGDHAYDEDHVIPESPDTRERLQAIFIDHDENKKKELAATAKALQNSFNRHNTDAMRRAMNAVDVEDKAWILRGQLENRPNQERLKQQNILKADGVVASTLHATSGRLGKQQIKDRLKKGLRNRSDSWELADRGIIQNKGVAPTLRETAAKLQKRQKQDQLRAGLGKRSTAKDLENKGIMFSSNIAARLQPNAAMLSQQLTAVKLLQTETLQQKGIIHRLYEIIQNKDVEINAIKELSAKQNLLIKNLKSVDSEQTLTFDGDLKRCCVILEHINTEIATFDVNCNKVMIDKIGQENADILVNPHSIFNNKLDKYTELVGAIGICSRNWTESIDGIRRYIRSKYVPDIANYTKWNLNEMILWIKSLENGRYNRHIDALIFGFKESEIFTGELLPDLSTADLSVTPFSIKSFKDKRDLVKHFGCLSDVEQRNEEEKQKGIEDDDDVDHLDTPRLIGAATNEVVQNIINTREKQNKLMELGSHDLDNVDDDDDTDINEQSEKVKIEDQYVD